MQGWHGHQNSAHFYTKQEASGLDSGILKRMADALPYILGTSENVRPNHSVDMAGGFGQRYDPTLDPTKENETKKLPGDFLHLFSKLQGPFQPNIPCEGNNYYPTVFGPVCQDKINMMLGIFSIGVNVLAMLS